MGCGCKSCGGLVPRQQRFVLDDEGYEVQPGDNVAQIAYLFGQPIDRWQELVGANLHKPLGDAPYGYKHKCFQSLEAGERLRIPGCWGPGAVSGPGAVGAPMFSGAAKFSPVYGATTIDQLTQMITAMNQSGVTPAIANILAAGGLSLPSNVDMNDVVAVMYSWWPYAKFPGVLPGVIPPLPTPATPAPVPFATLVAMGRQAVEFLRATGITNGKSPQVQDIPWDSIQWKDIPWNTLGTQTLQEISQVLTGVPLPAYTTPAVAIPNQSPDFFNTNFGDQAWSDILKDVDWSDSLADVLSDPEAVACIKKDPNRLKTLSSCPECYADTEAFKKLLCGSEANPCDCKEEPAPPTPEPGKTAQAENNTALIVAASVIGVLGIAATAFALSSRKG